MRIGVLGAGSVGLFVGGCLASAGAEVEFVGREPPSREPPGLDWRCEGLRLTDRGGRDERVAPARLRHSTDPGALQGCELILVAVKSGQTAQAASALEGVVGPRQTVLSLQNGIGNGAVLAMMLPKVRVLRGMVPFNIVRQGPCHLHRATTGDIMVEDDPSLAPAAALFSAARLPIARRGDIEAVQWAKLLMNLNNAINALSGLPLRRQLADRGFRQCLALAQDEALALLKRESRIEPARLTPLPAAWTPHVLRLPDALFSVLARGMLKIDPSARSSMADDLSAGRPTEVDFINGEIVFLAHRLGRHAPVNARLCDLVHRASRGRSAPWRAEELLAELEASRRVRGRTTP